MDNYETDNMQGPTEMASECPAEQEAIEQPPPNPAGTEALEAFEKYIGIKIIEAHPEMKDGQEGYAVLYNRGTRFPEYRSWSPYAVFADAYMKIDGLEHATAVVEGVSRLSGLLVEQGILPEITDEAEKKEATTGESFGTAIEVLRRGGKVTRKGWMDKKKLVAPHPHGYVLMGSMHWQPTAEDMMAQDWVYVPDEKATEEKQA